MREIKFRVWDKSIHTYSEAMEEKEPSGQMIDNMDYLINSDYFKDALNGKYPIMQLTGFKDKNGKDIYDGDIISDWTETDEGLKQSFCPVFWFEKGGCWHLDCSFSKNRSYSYPLFNELKEFKYEITGNIFENPELISNVNTNS